MNRTMIKAIFQAMAAPEFRLVFGIAGGMILAASATHFMISAGAGPGVAWDLSYYGFIVIVIMMVSAMLSHAMRQCTKVEAEVEFERRFREILSEINLLTICLDNNGRVSFCNDAFLEATAWERHQVIGGNWVKKFIPPHHRKAFSQAVSRAVASTKADEHFECEINTPDEESRLVSWSICKIHNSYGQAEGVACIGTDITAARASEVQLRKLSYAVEQSPSVIMIVDTKGRIEYLNPKFTELTGYTLAELRGKNPRILKSGETTSDEYKELWETVSGGGEWRGLFHNKKKNGELYWESAAISAIRDGDGNISHYLAVKEDVTDRLRLEKEVAERNRVIAKTQALAATGKMANMIAHDLRNPLSSIKMGLQMLGKRSSRDWREEELEMRQISLGQITYMEEILDDLLTFSRPDALTLEWLSIDTVLDTTVITVQKVIQDTKVRVSCDYQSGLPTIHGDVRKLRQVFSNILINAIQASETLPLGRRKITISAELTLGDRLPGVRVRICDRGQGIEKGLEDQVFEPFFTTRPKGTGLGLAIVKRIIDQHFGAVTLIPGEPLGTCVIVDLPVGPIHQDMDREIAARSVTGTGEEKESAGIAEIGGQEHR